MSNVLKMLSRGGAAAAETDPNFNQTVLLLHGDGTNGAQNNTFLDGSTNNFTITRNGNTTQGTFSPFSLAAGEWSLYANGSSSLSVAGLQTLFAGWGGRTRTFESWIYRDGTSDRTLQGAYNAVSANGRWVISIASNKLRFTYTISAGSEEFVETVGTIPSNSWAHIAVVVDSTTDTNTTIYLCINGTVETFTGKNFSTQTTTYGWNAIFAQPIYFPGSFLGYASNMRWSSNLRYTSNFSVPTTPFTSDANTLALLFANNRLVDTSSNAGAVTISSGAPRVTPFSPFAPTAAYSAGTNGGSGYFDGSGDYLSISTNSALDFGTGDFTVEFWCYASTFASQQNIISSGGSSFTTNSTRIGKDVTLGMSLFSNNGTGVILSEGNGNFILNAWNHYVVTRSGNSFTIYKNGVSVATGTSTGSVNLNQGGSTVVASTGWSIGDLWPGYISGLKVVKGTATAPSGVPTAPPTGGNLLLNFTNAGIFDNTGKNVLETVADAQIDTTTKKYGTGSMEFDGTGDVLRISPSSEFIGSGNFTIEGWIRQTGSSGYKFIYSATGGTDDWNKNLNGFGVYFNNGLFGINSNTLNLNDSSAINLNQWYHFAVVRSGTSIKGYIDGVQRLSGTSSESFGNASSAAALGTQDFFFGPSSPRNIWQGYIDDLRITKGVARYTAAFTPPTKEFPDL